MPARMYELRLYRGLRLLRSVQAPLDPKNDDLVRRTFLDQIEGQRGGTLHRVDLSLYTLDVVGLHGGRRYVRVTMTYDGEWVIRR